MNSFNHYSFGAVGEWLFSTVAGIDTDPDSPASAISSSARSPAAASPRPARAYDSIRGPIATRLEAGRRRPRLST